MKPMRARWFGWALALLLAPGAAQAWNKAGHMTSGAIAYDDLVATHPAVAARVVALLRQHPQFDERWKALVEAPGLSADDANRRLFMLAARWPDDVRGDHDFDHPEDHFIDLPYKPPGQPASVKPPPPPADTLVTAYAENVEAVTAGTDDVARAVALCWLFHLTGDVHQPLHTISLFTTKYPAPEGDRGGTRFQVRVTATGKAVSLHSLWDGFVIGSESFQAVANEATSLRLSRARADLPELAAIPFGATAVAAWARQESFEIAKKDAYRNGHLKGSPDKAHAPVLPDGYVGQAKAVAERRMVLAGYRLADVLSALFASQ